MPHSIVVPQMGESVVEGTIGQWLKAEGDPIDKDDTIVEIMTDKVNVEIPAIASGTLGKILVPEGTVVEVGTEIGIILEAGESLPEGAGSATAAKSAQAGSDDGGSVSTATATAVAEPPSRPTAPSPEKKKSSPVVRRLLREHNLTLEEIPATGAKGRVTKQDVLNYVRDRKPATAPGAGTFPTPTVPSQPSPAFAATAHGAREETVERKPFAGVRKMIADHMVASKQTSAHVMTMDEIDLTELVKMREAKKAEWRAKVGANVTYLPFFMKSAIAALKEFPTVNASIHGNEIVMRKYYHMGMAVGRDEGLIVPVIKFADQKSIAEIAREAADLSDRARREQLKPDEVSGSTFTFTNAGMFGALASTPVINQPEVAILGMHLIQKRPVVRNDEIVIRDMMYVSLSFDHRLIDGHTAVQFLRRLCERLENPWELMLTIG